VTRAVWVNGVFHRNLVDAAITMHMNYGTLRKRLCEGNAVDGFTVSHHPPPDPRRKVNVYPGAFSLIRHPETNR